MGPFISWNQRKHIIIGSSHITENMMDCRVLLPNNGKFFFNDSWDILNPNFISGKSIWWKNMHYFSWFKYFQRKLIWIGRTVAPNCVCTNIFMSWYFVTMRLGVPSAINFWERGGRYLKKPFHRKNDKCSLWMIFS